MNPDAPRVLDTVDQMLLEAGHEDNADLRSALLSLGTLADMPVPAPGPRLAALLSGSPAHASAAHTTRREALTREAAVRQEAARRDSRFRSDELARRRALRRNRSAVVGLTVMAGMGLGVTSVAASLPTAKDNNASVQQLLEDWTPHWTIQVPTAAADNEAGRESVTAAEPEAADAQNAQGAASDVPAQEAGPAGGPGQSGTAGNGRPQAPHSTATPTAGTHSQMPTGHGSQPAGAGREAAGPGQAEATKPEGPRPFKAESSGTGQKASPGARWLKKFGQ